MDVKENIKKLLPLLINWALCFKKGVGVFARPLIDWLSMGDKRAGVRYSWYYRFYPVKKKQILYESFLGRGMSCNPYALFRAFLADEKYRKHTHVWVYENKESFRHVIAEFKGNPSVKFVSRDHRAYLKCLATSGILINNLSFGTQFSKRNGQCYINTWHGIPLKTIGYDVPHGEIVGPNTFRDFLQTDYILAANALMTDKYRNTAYRLETGYNGTILEEGYPRQDLLWTDRDYIFNKMASYGIKIDRTKQIILYAPTWKGDSFSNPVNDVDELISLKAQLETMIDTEKYQILLRPHYTLYQILRSMPNVDYIVPSTIDGNETLAITDILLGDYSSIYFDFLATGRPILFYITDSEEYFQYRGVYFGLEHLPAPHTNDISVIAQWINEIEGFAKQHAEQYQRAVDFIQFADRKNIARTVIEVALEGKTDTNGIIQHKSDKIKILFTYHEVGHQDSLISMCEHIKRLDQDRFDLTVYIGKSKLETRKDLVHSLTNHARVVMKHGAICTSFLEMIVLKMCEYFPSTLVFHQKKLKKIYKREAMRAVGGIQFDYVLNYSGDNQEISMFAGFIPCKNRYIWLQKPLTSPSVAEQGQESYYKAICTRYDKIVSPSQSVHEINKQTSYLQAIRNRFTYATNPMNDEGFLQGRNTPEKIIKIDGISYLQGLSTSGIKRFIPLSFQSTAQVSEQRGAVTRFVTTGNCIASKNYRELIQGFELIQSEYPNTMLYLVGDGNRFRAEFDFILKRKLQHKIVMVDSLVDSYQLLKQCDCFLVSAVEDQHNLDVLRARMVNIPILITDYQGSSGVCVENGQTIMGTTAQGLYHGMKSWIQGDVVSNYQFDSVAYNEKCHQEFEDIIK